MAALFLMPASASATAATEQLTLGGGFFRCLEPLTKFWPAEDYHQQVFELHGEEPYCSLVVIAPKIARFRKRFKDLPRTSS